MKSYTPRTDAVTCGKGYGIPGNTVSADFARQLERELNNLRRIAANYHSNSIPHAEHMAEWHELKDALRRDA
jgi:hypothetical protein